MPADETHVGWLMFQNRGSMYLLVWQIGQRLSVQAGGQRPTTACCILKEAMFSCQLKLCCSADTKTASVQLQAWLVTLT